MFIIVLKRKFHWNLFIFHVTDQDFNVRAVSPTGCPLSPEHIIPQNQASPAVEHIEQSVTIIPNLRAVKKRRKSMADYAFPELHPEAQLQENSSILRMKI